MNLITHSLRADGFDASEDGTGRGIPLTVGTLSESSGHARPGDNIQSVGYLIPALANPMTARMHKGINTTCDEGQTMIVHAPAIAFHNRQDPDVSGDVTHPIGAASDAVGTLSRSTTQAVAFNNTGHGWWNEAVAAATVRTGGGGARESTIALTGTAVRRLTPTECERLQGFPDSYTAIQWRGKPAADGPRYKALGNSMAVPCMAWIGRRIAMTTSAAVPHADPALR